MTDTRPRISVRLTEEELALLAALANHYGISRTDIIRAAIRDLGRSAGVLPAPSKRK